jgi:hypothetical protein
MNSSGVSDVIMQVLRRQAQEGAEEPAAAEEDACGVQEIDRLGFRVSSSCPAVSSRASSSFVLIVAVFDPMHLSRLEVSRSSELNDKAEPIALSLTSAIWPRLASLHPHSSLHHPRHLATWNAVPDRVEASWVAPPSSARCRLRVRKVLRERDHRESLP